MKTEILTKEKPKSFEPVEIKITIENEKDLAWLLGISNSDLTTTKENLKFCPKLVDALKTGHGDSQMAFYRLIADIAKKKGYTV